MHFYHDEKTGAVYIDNGSTHYKIDLPEMEYEEVLYVIQSETFKAILEQLLRGQNNGERISST